MAKTNTLAKLAFTEVPGSSTIASFAQTGITPTTVGDMFVKFINGNTYKYSGVDMKTFAELKESASKGKYFSSNIRNKFVATKV